MRTPAMPEAVEGSAGVEAIVLLDLGHLSALSRLGALIVTKACSGPEMPSKHDRQIQHPHGGGKLYMFEYIQGYGVSRLHGMCS